MARSKSPVVGIVIAGMSDWETMHHAAEMLVRFDLAYKRIVMRASRMRKPARKRAGGAFLPGVNVIIASASGKAGLPGALARKVHVPVLGVPIAPRARDGLQRLQALARLPAGVPVASLAIGEAGAKNAALLAVQILALSDAQLRSKLRKFRLDQTHEVMQATLEPPRRSGV